jgi:hypothetical protein
MIDWNKLFSRAYVHCQHVPFAFLAKASSWGGPAMGDDIEQCCLVVLSKGLLTPFSLVAGKNEQGKLLLYWHTQKRKKPFPALARCGQSVISVGFGNIFTSGWAPAPLCVLLSSMPNQCGPRYTRKTRSDSWRPIHKSVPGLKASY